MSRQKRVLVTGATGFVGANLARRLLADGHDVSLLHRRDADLWRLDEIGPECRLLEGDLRDREGLERLVRNLRPAWIFNLAAYGAYSWQTDRRRMIETNVVGTDNLLCAAAAAGAEAFVGAGSSSEYGFKDHPPTEDEPVEPNSAYAATKAAATILSRQHARSEHLHVVTLRLYSAYGPYEEPARFVPTLAVNALRGRLPPLVDPKVARDFVYVEEVCDAFVRAAEASDAEPGAVYNVGTGTQTTISDAVAAARAIFEITERPVWGSMPDRAWDTSVWVGDPRKIASELGWSAAVDFPEGLRRVAEWLSTTPLRPRYFG